MLAYVFWHHPRADTPLAAYEADLVTFHLALAAAAVTGFHSSAPLRVTGVPWINDGMAAYEDWYLLAGSAALDPLNDAAVSARRKTPHDRAAAAVAAGAGGLYRLRSGIAAPNVSCASWFSKPPGMSYEALDALLRPCMTGKRALWQRQMVLGPGREFCLDGTGAALPDALNVCRVERVACDRSIS